ncbi:MAG TPA: oxaloacetate decarboxylase [Victivallales bacterium]|nr:oxaloacetate decarboxylase [Victivallales bacterium]
MNKCKRFRDLVDHPEILLMPCCYDSLSAKVFESIGFKAIGAAGYGVTGSCLGKPDIGLLSGMELVNQYKNICASVDIPVFVDIDTGYGDVNNVIRIVQEVEKIGAAGLFIEDQKWPKRCGHMDGKEVVAVEEYIPKLKAALWARKNPDFVIMARTDAASVLGVDEAVMRAKLYCKAGADMLFVEALDNVEDMKKVNNVLKELNKPSMANMVEGGKTPLIKSSDLNKYGYSLVAYPCSAVYTAVKALSQMGENLLKNGSTENSQNTMLNFDEYNKFIGLDHIRNRERLFFE